MTKTNHAHAAQTRAPAHWQPVLIYLAPDDGTGIERGTHKLLPGPSYSDQMTALRVAVAALDGGQYPSAIGAAAVREASDGQR